MGHKVGGTKSPKALSAGQSSEAVNTKSWVESCETGSPSTLGNPQELAPEFKVPTLTE